MPRLQVCSDDKEGAFDVSRLSDMITTDVDAVCLSSGKTNFIVVTNACTNRHDIIQVRPSGVTIRRGVSAHEAGQYTAAMCAKGYQNVEPEVVCHHLAQRNL